MNTDSSGPDDQTHSKFEDGDEDEDDDEEEKDDDDEEDGEDNGEDDDGDILVVKHILRKGELYSVSFNCFTVLVLLFKQTTW